MQHLRGDGPQLFADVDGGQLLGGEHLWVGHRGHRLNVLGQEHAVPAPDRAERGAVSGAVAAPVSPETKVKVTSIGHMAVCT